MLFLALLLTLFFSSAVVVTWVDSKLHFPQLYNKMKFTQVDLASSHIKPGFPILSRLWWKGWNDSVREYSFRKSIQCDFVLINTAIYIFLWVHISYIIAFVTSFSRCNLHLLFDNWNQHCILTRVTQNLNSIQHFWIPAIQLRSTPYYVINGTIASQHTNCS